MATAFALVEGDRGGELAAELGALALSVLSAGIRVDGGVTTTPPMEPDGESAAERPPPPLFAADANAPVPDALAGRSVAAGLEVLAGKRLPPPPIVIERPIGRSRVLLVGVPGAVGDALPTCWYASGGRDDAVLLADANAAAAAADAAAAAAAAVVCCAGDDGADEGSSGTLMPLRARAFGSSSRFCIEGEEKGKNINTILSYKRTMRENSNPSSLIQLKNEREKRKRKRKCLKIPLIVSTSLRSYEPP